MSQERLAEKAGHHRTYISMIENRGDNPSLEGLEDIAEALDMEAWELFKFED